MKHGEKLLMSYLTAPNETLRDIDGDENSIVEILEALEGIHTLFLEMLIDLKASEAPEISYSWEWDDFSYDEYEPRPTIPPYDPELGIV